MKKQGFITIFLITFASSILVVSILGYLLQDMVTSISQLFALGALGLSYPAIFEIALLSFMISLYSYVLFETHVLKNYLVLYKVILMFLLSGITTAVFVAIFGWFPISEWKGWIGFFLSFLLCFIIATGGMLYKNKKEEQRYNACLKEKQKEKDDE